MAGKLGADFDATQPADSDYVKYGALWIRDIKQRLKVSMAVLFNLETGDLKDNVVRWQALKDLAPNPTGTWKEVDVNAKGQVVAGRNPALNFTAQPYRAIFVVSPSTASAYMDQPNAAPLNLPGTLLNYTGTGVFSKVYPQPFAYWSFTMEVPEGVTRMKCFLVGAGGGGWGDAGPTSGWHSGAGGEYREAIIPVTPGANISVIVGTGGISAVDPTTTGGAGGVSAVSTGSVYVEAAGGGAGTNTTDGADQVGAQSSSIQSIIHPGGDAVAYAYGASGAYLGFIDGQSTLVGTGGNWNSPTPRAGSVGFVVLEWFKV